MRRLRWMAVLSLPLAFVLAAEGVAAQGGVVARAAGMELGVEEAAQLLTANPESEASASWVAGIADLWVDYTLLAAAVAADPALGPVDLERLGAPLRDRAVVAAFLEREVPLDTVFTDAEVQATWKAENPNFSGPPKDYRKFLAFMRWQAAAEHYADSVSAAAEMRIQPGAIAVFHEIWRSGGSEPRPSVLVSFRGGELTASEVAAGVRSIPVARRAMSEEELSDGLESMLRGLATDEILLLRAREQGIEPEPAVMDSIRATLRHNIAGTVALAGLDGKVFPAAGPARDAAVRAHVLALLRGTEKEVLMLVPLGNLGMLLRENGRGQVFPETYPAVVARVRAIRAARP